MEIEIKTVPEYQVAFIIEKGSYQKVPETLGKVVGWLMTKQVEIQMPVYGIYYNNPMEVPEEELTWEVGAAFLGELEGEDVIQIKKVQEHEVVSAVFKGPYSEIHLVYGELFQYTMKNGYQIAGPPLENYLNDPNLVPESEILTEVQFPVLKQ